MLHFVNDLVIAGRSGMPGNDLLHFAGVIEPDDLDTMVRAINEGCEQVNPDEW